MTTDSLIQIIQSACTDEHPYGSTCSVSLRDAERIANAITKSLPEKFAEMAKKPVKEERFADNIPITGGCLIHEPGFHSTCPHCIDTPINLPQPSEISLLNSSEAQIARYNAINYIGNNLKGWENYAGIEKHIDALIAILRAPEQVSVSLKKCVDAIALSGLYDSDINDAIDYYEAVAKAVLDAAGVAYVE